MEIREAWRRPSYGRIGPRFVNLERVWGIGGLKDQRLNLFSIKACIYDTYWRKQGPDCAHSAIQIRTAMHLAYRIGRLPRAFALPALLTLLPASGFAQDIQINELRIDQPGEDTDEYVE